MDIHAEKRVSSRMGGIGEEMHYLTFLFNVCEGTPRGG